MEHCGFWYTDQTNPPEFSIPATSLDNYFSSGERIDLVKIDVEGAGYEVVAGMQRILKQARPILVFEVHSTEEWGSRKYLTEADYTVYSLLGKKMDEPEEFVFHCIAAPNDRRVKSFCTNT